MRESEADLNRAAYLGPLATTWLPAVPELHERLQAGARVADVGCGEAWSAIGIARGYPRTSVDGFDIDGAAIERALVHVAAAGLGDRVRVLRRDVRDLPREGRYDVVTAFECVHDLAFPVVALSAIRRSLAPDGLVLVADMRAEEEPRFPAGPVERLLYGYSIGVCLPDAMATPGSAQTGTVLRPSTLEQYAREAGFGRVEDAGVEHDLWRFWLLAA
jgi:SAM-dependent methyltransferase